MAEKIHVKFCMVLRVKVGDACAGVQHTPAYLASPRIPPPPDYLGPITLLTNPHSTHKNHQNSSCCTNSNIIPALSKWPAVYF